MPFLNVMCVTQFWEDVISFPYSGDILAVLQDYFLIGVIQDLGMEDVEQRIAETGLLKPGRNDHFFCKNPMTV